MHLGEISFCDRVGFNVKSDEHKKKILEGLDSWLNFRVIQRHYQKFDPSNVQLLQQRPHMVSVRSNGNPYLLLLTKYNFVNQCIFIDKKIQQGYYYPRMILSKFWFDDSLYNNTLLDGEMVRVGHQKWMFLINDIIAENGVQLETINLQRRISRVHEILNKRFMPDPLNPCIMQVKKYFKYDEWRHVVDTFIPSLPYTCRGLYFKPLFLRFKDVLLNFDDSVIIKVKREKFKERSNFLMLGDIKHAGAADSCSDSDCATATTTGSQQDDQNSIDTSTVEEHDGASQLFYMRKTNAPDLYHLFKNIQSDNHMIACIPTLSLSKKMRDLFRDSNPSDHKKVWCTFSDKFKKWIPNGDVQS